MPDLLAITGPIFLLVGLGWAALRFGLYPAAGLPALGGFIVKFALPALLFKAVAQRSVAEVANPRYLLVYALGSLAAAGAGLLWGRWRGQSREAAAMTAMGMSCANSAFVGYPVVLQALGPEAGVAVALTMMVENFLMIPLCLALADSAGQAHEPFGRAMLRALAGLRRNPIVMAIVAGFAFALAQGTLPAPVWRAVDLLAASASAAALFYIGGSLTGLRVGPLLAQVSAVAVGKLLLHPLGVVAALVLCGPLPPVLGTAAVLLACSPMLGVYPILGQKYGQQGVNAASMLVTTTASAFSLAVALVLLQHLGWLTLHGG